MKRIGVVGLGYVGLTLAVSLARRGLTVFGGDREQRVVDAIASGQPHFYEPGLAKGLQENLGTTLHVGVEIPRDTVDAVVLCVSTPVDPETREPRLDHLRDAAQSVAASCAPETLVVVRSTVPVGTTRSVVLPELVARWGQARLAFCPERTIQGQAVRELETLPQVIGGLDDASRDAAVELFRHLVARTVVVSSLEAAEMVKLVNNCHTDLIYSFGNEVALLAERVGVDPLEVIHAANVDYPRPDVARPGFVGGGCLSKDPYLLVASARATGHEPWLVGRARALNEYLPGHVARRFLEILAGIRGGVDGARICLLGFAYKGSPPTDDMRGAPVLPILDVLRRERLTVVGHDFLVRDDVLRGLGVEPLAAPEEGFAGSDGVLVITDHPGYAALDLRTLVPTLRRPALVYDCWRVMKDGEAHARDGVRYAGIGYG